MSTCNHLDLERLGSSSIRTKNLPKHCSQRDFRFQEPKIIHKFIPNLFLVIKRVLCITLFIFITVLCGIDNILHNILNVGIFYKIMSVPQNIVMNLNNVMCALTFTK
jgi:hypothetical protein